MDYKNGKIYELKHTENNKVFIGSTCTTLAKRLFSTVSKLMQVINQGWVMK